MKSFKEVVIWDYKKQKWGVICQSNSMNKGSKNIDKSMIKNEYGSIKLEHMIDMWVKKSQKFTKAG